MNTYHSDVKHLQNCRIFIGRAIDQQLGSPHDQVADEVFFHLRVRLGPVKTFVLGDLR